MRKIENVYTLKPNYDDPTPQRKTYTGTWMPVEEYWKLLDDYLGDLDTANGFVIDDPYHFSKEADRLWPVTICFIHPEIEGIVGEKTLSEEELWNLLDKLQDQDCEERKKIYTLKPNYDDPTPQRKTYTGMWMPVEEYWKLLDDYLDDFDTANGFAIKYTLQFSKEADRLWPVTICFIHPEIEGIVGEKTISEEELYELLDKLQDEDCEESEEGEEDEK